MRPLFIVFDHGDWIEVFKDQRKANVIPMFKKGKEDPGNYRPVGFTLTPGKVME